MGRAVAWVNGVPVDLSDVDAREHAVRSGPAAAALPGRDTSEGRQLRRWLVQVLAAERLIAVEAARLNITAADAPPLHDVADDRAGVLELGSVAASVLAQSPLARAVFLAVTRDIDLSPERITRYYADNIDQFTIAERRVVRHAVLTNPGHRPRLNDRPLRTLRRGELTGMVERAVFAAAIGAVIGPVHDPLGWHVLRVEAVEPARVLPLVEVRGQIARRLLASARRRAFGAWLDRQTAELVRLAPGFEHPGDPGQPDNTHRH